ncbi:MAG: GNAT family N-acetyltransferase [Christensenellaceae bacterium]|jgi:ribosomal protein S18 acetylase RimI-like enzyme
MEMKRCSMDDLAQLCKIADQTYRETFEAHNTRADMDAYTAQAFSARQLALELACPYSAFFFATEGGMPVGYLKLNDGPAQTEPDMDGSVEIERIYTLRAYHGKGLGRRILDHAIGCAVEKAKAFLWLGVWEHNHRAIRFYEKNGFTCFGKHPFLLGEDVQTDLLMRKNLRE